MNKNQQDALNKATWNKVAHRYAAKFMSLSLYDHTYDAFLMALGASKHDLVLEIGCGPGNCTKYLLDHSQKLRVTGIDIAADMLDLAKKNNPEAVFIELDGRLIHSLDTSYGGIFCGFFIPYISADELSRFLRDCHQRLHSQGVLYLSFVSKDPSQSGIVANDNGDQMYFNFHPKEHVLDSLAVLGFTILFNQDLPYPESDGQTSLHTVIIAQKIN